MARTSSRRAFESETDDFIAIRRGVRDSKIRMGLTIRTFDSQSETFSEEEEDDKVDKLKRGQIKVKWYPTGKETKIPQQKAILLDRVLDKGDIVTRIDDPNRKIGQVVHKTVTGDLAVLPKKQTIIKDVDISRCAFVDQYDPLHFVSFDVPVVYDAWISVVEATFTKVFIRSAKGQYKGFIWSHYADEILDATHSARGIRMESAWYPSQPLVVPSECLSRVEWTQGCKPPRRFRPMASSRSRSKFTVEKVVLDCIAVRCVLPISGCREEASKMCPPETTVRGEELKKVKKIESWEWNVAKIGDRMVGRVEPTGVLMSERDWQWNLDNFEITDRHMDDDSIAVADTPRKRVPPSRFSDKIDTPRSSIQENEDQFTASKYSGKSLTEAEDNAEERESIPPSAKELISGRKAPSRSRRAKIRTVTFRTARKMFKSAGKTAKKKINRRKKKKGLGTEKKNRKIDTLDVSGTYVGELIFRRSYLDVMWQDGRLEKRIPSIELARNKYDLDQHQYWPGSFVLLNGDEKKWPEKGFGIVTKASSEEKVATVAWYEVSACDGGPQWVKTEKVSSYDLGVHPDYDRFVPGQCVMRVGKGVEMEESGGSILANIGQIIMVQPDLEKVSVRWMDCKTGPVWPTEILVPSTIQRSPDWVYQNDSFDVSSVLQNLKDQMNLLYSMEQNECIEARVRITHNVIEILKDSTEGLLRARLAELLATPRGIAEQLEFLEQHEQRLGLLAFVLNLMTGNESCDIPEHNSFILDKSAVAEEIAVVADSSDSFTEENHLFEELKEQRLKFLKRILNDLPEDCSDYVSEMKTNPRSSQSLAWFDLIIFRLIDEIVQFFKPFLETVTDLSGNAADPSSSRGLGVAATPPDSPSSTDASGKCVSAGTFEVLEKAPSSHSYLHDKWKPGTGTPCFLKAVREEMTVMHTSLPAGIFVKGYEDRTDLFSCMIIGPKNTPFADGIFLFDVNLPQEYPREPPLVYYKSYSSQQLNPNLYQNGRVCLSLLGTWMGRSCEVWNPGSNLLQVFVSIQGLILTAEPYFNEAGFESRRAVGESVEKSRRYNESALIGSIENLARIAENPPNCFNTEITGHIKAVGLRLFTEISLWIDGEKECGFPLQPVSAGCKMSASRHLEKLRSICNEEK